MFLSPSLRLLCGCGPGVVLRVHGSLCFDLGRWSFVVLGACLWCHFCGVDVGLGLELLSLRVVHGLFSCLIVV